MFKGLVLFCTVLSAFAGTVESKPWQWVAKPIKAFSDHQVLAIAVDGNRLLVGSFLKKAKQSGFEIYDLKSGTMKEMADKIHLDKQDSISHILVDSQTNHVWIAVNNNLGAAKCYDDKWLIMKCDRAFLEAQVNFLKDAATKDMASIETGARDDSGGVVGEFKGGIYLMNGKDLKKVYAPKNPFQWAVASALTPTLAFVGTKGDGLIVINRASQNIERHPDHDEHDFAAAVATANNKIYIGGNGLYQAPVSAFDVK